jgi:alpha-glucosidase
MTLATVLGTGLSGQPYNGPDVGGFSGNPSAELYLRWFQMAAFMPFFRTHSAIGVARREPWVYGEPYTRIVRETLRMRYNLLPYLYTLAWQASRDGSPLVRPLFWDTPQDQALWQVDDAFLLGPVLLVAPFFKEGETRRAVRLPAGNWYCLWDGSAHKGPGEVEIHSGLEHIPVLAHGGSLLPLAADGRLALHLYAPGDAFREGLAGQVYSDAGDGYGLWRLDSFHLLRKGRGFELSWRSQGDFTFPYQQVELHLHGWQSPRAWVDDEPATLRNGRILCAPFSSIRIEALR